MNLLTELPDQIHVVEMLPRDGFQRLDEFVPTDEKVEIIDTLSETGVDEIEISSFTHPKAVPTLRDADEVAKKITRNDDVTYRALVPNLVGMERAVEAEVDKVNALVTVSETYTENNQNRTREAVLAEMDDIVELAHDHGIEVEAGMGTSFYCPYEGQIDAEETLAVVDSVVDSGVDEVTLATTMGLANPVEITERFSAAFEAHPDLDMGLHLHDTNGMSLANTLAAMAVGVDRFDASVCGLGGGVVLPEGMSGVGNTPTEDLVQMLTRMGVDHGVDFDRIEAAAHDVSDRLGLGATSHVLMGGTVERVLETVAADKQEN
ncbi:hydroxymethylglutaryl-CoA lyase [Haloferax sp. MBLA0076]|uniref:Hydroxymethylglutaryl-CoA lyase n=1 Tax=Haloferax litoreum TaxID=2666140 RepID=A0A6A8GKX7_9EURY|nr:MULTISPECIES: hydroxymethylglutaryl-CoA lyase [Haloferax]KAB1190041.1 hydroxymethylglutaryl-CoA lyase [Haloferax sp. CBA1148]MRX23815.1 hydroxymethylglutaryl-CoA lyase [Haloferax litoreum]